MKQKTGSKLLSFLLTLAMVVGLMPGMGLTAYAETQVKQVNYRYNDGMTLNTISADFYDDDSLKSFSATYTWGWGPVKQSLVLLDTLIACESGDYATTYCKDDNNESITSYEASKNYVVNKNPETKFVAESENPDTVAELGNGTHTKTLSLAKGAVPSDVSKTYYLFLWTSKSPGEVYPDYHLATVIVSGGKLYIGQGESVPVVPTYTVTLTGGDNATPSGGNTTQSGLKGKMTDVVYTANDGYYFPTDYSVAAVNGISVTRNSYTQITVSGTPTADATITLTAPTAKTTPAVSDFTYTGPGSFPTYDGTAKTATVVPKEGVTGMGNVTVKYYSDPERETEVQSPTDVGTYYVGITLDEGNIYHNASSALYDQDWQFTISKQGAPTSLNDNQKPTANTGLTYTGNELELVTAPASALTGYTVQYSLDGTNWSTDIPKGTNAGDYTVKVKYVGDENHEDFNGTDISVTIGKVAAPTLTDDQKPTAKTGLTYTGSDQALVTAPSEIPDGYIEVQYALGTATEATQPYTTSIPTGTEAGTYYVWYYVKGDSNHTDSEPVCIMVKIAGAAYTVTDGEHTINDGKDTSVTVKRDPDDSKTYDLYTGAQVDGKDLPEGSHTTAKGSLILTLKAAYLDTLTVGDHKLTIAFEDGSATATIKIKEAEPTPTPAPTAAPTATPKPVPKTGDSADLALWLGLAVAGLILIAGTVILWNRKKRCGK